MPTGHFWAGGVPKSRDGSHAVAEPVLEEAFRAYDAGKQGKAPGEAPGPALVLPRAEFQERTRLLEKCGCLSVRCERTGSE
jgi:hypothetical protein